MKKIVAGLLACWALTLGTEAADSTWTTDLSAAKAKAKAENKMVLLDFTGSDWCPPCKALQQNVLSKQDFLEYAKDHLVLVEIDFPRTKPQSEDLQKTNRALATQYNIEAFPTVIVLSSDGKELQRQTGYSGKDAEAYVQELKKLGT